MGNKVSNCDDPKLLKVYILSWIMCSNGYHTDITQFCTHEVWCFFTHWQVIKGQEDDTKKNHNIPISQNQFTSLLYK